MAIKESGVRLSVQNLSGFVSDLNRAEQAYKNFGSGGAKSLALGDIAAGLSGSVDRELGTVRAKFGTLNSFAAGIFAGMGAALGSALVSGVTTAAGAIPNLIGKAFSEAISLEQASADAFAIRQPSAQEQAALASLAESVALNPNLKVSQQGALEAIDAALKANLSVQQIATGGIIEAIVSQQNALGGSFEENARLIAKQLNDQAGAVEQLSAQQLADQNVGTFQAGQFRTVNDLLLAQAAAGGALKSLGVSQQQFNELLSIAGTTASGGSDAGTSVKAFINAATNASKEQAAAQKALGFNVADSQGQFNDALTLAQQLSAARIEGINAIIETGGGTKEQQAALKKLNAAYNKNLTAASNLEAGITGANLSSEKRSEKIATANAQAQAAKREFDAMLNTIPGLKQTAIKIQASETEFAGLLFQAFGTDGGRFAAALSGLSEEEAARVRATIEGASALEVAAIKTDTVRAKLEAVQDVFTANIAKIAKPTLQPLKEVLASVAELGGRLTPVFDLAGKSIANLVSGPLTNLSSFLDQIKVSIEEDGTKIDLGKLFQFDNTDFQTSLNIGDFIKFDDTSFVSQLQIGPAILSVIKGQNKVQLQLGDFLDITGGITPDGVFTLSLNDQNFSVDLAAINTFVSGIPQKIGDAIRLAFTDPAAFVFNASAFVSGAKTAVITAIETAFGSETFSVTLPNIATDIKTQIEGFFSAETFTVTIPNIATGIKTQIENFFSGETFAITIPDFATNIKTNIETALTNLVSGIDVQGAISAGFNALIDPNFGIGGLVNLIPGISGTTATLATLAAINYGSITAGLTGVVSGLGAVALPAISAGLAISTIVGSINLLNQIDVEKFSGLGTTISDTLTGILDFGTKLTESINAEGLAQSADGFVTGFIDRISATISGVDTGAISTSALGFATSILGKLTTVFSDPNLGADIGASAAGLVGSLVNSLSGVFSDPQAFANFGSGATNLAISIGGFVTSLVGSFGTELSKVNFEELATNGVLSFAGLATGVGNAITTALTDKIDKILGTKLASPQQKFEAFINALINKINELPILSNLVTTEAEKQAQAAALASLKQLNVVSPQTIEASSLGAVNAQTIAETQAAQQELVSAIKQQGNVVSPQTIEAQSLAQTAQQNAQAATQASQSWSEALQQAGVDLATFAARTVANNLTSLPVTAGGANGLGFVGVTTVDLTAGNVKVDGAKVTTPNGEPQVTFTPQTGPIQGPLTQAQAAAQQSPFANVTGPIPVVIQNPTTTATPATQSAATPVGGGSGFLAPSFKAAEAATTEITTGASALSASLKAAGSSVKANVAGAKIPPFKWPVIAPVNLGSRVPPFRWPDVGSVNLGNYIPAFPGWEAIIPFVNVPAIPPFPGWQAFVKTVTVQVPSTSGGGGNTSPAPDPGTGSGPRSGKRPGAAFTQPVDTAPIVESTAESTSAIIKALQETSDSTGTTNIKNYSIKIYSVNGGGDLLRALLTGSNVEKKAAELEAGISGGLSLANPFTNGGQLPSLNDRPLGIGGKSLFGNKNANASQNITNLVATPPQVTNNYYNTKNYNLNVYTVQSEAALTEQFAYMQHLAAAL